MCRVAESHLAYLSDLLSQSEYYLMNDRKQEENEMQLKRERERIEQERRQKEEAEIQARKDEEARKRKVA